MKSSYTHFLLSSFCKCHLTWEGVLSGWIKDFGDWEIVLGHPVGLRSSHVKEGGDSQSRTMIRRLEFGLRRRRATYPAAVWPPEAGKAKPTFSPKASKVKMQPCEYLGYQGDQFKSSCVMMFVVICQSCRRKLADQSLNPFPRVPSE